MSINEGEGGSGKRGGLAGEGVDIYGTSILGRIPARPVLLFSGVFRGFIWAVLRRCGMRREMGLKWSVGGSNGRFKRLGDVDLAATIFKLRRR